VVTILDAFEIGNQLAVSPKATEDPIHLELKSFEMDTKLCMYVCMCVYACVCV